MGRPGRSGPTPFQGKHGTESDNKNKKNSKNTFCGTRIGLPFKKKNKKHLVNAELLCLTGVHHPCGPDEPAGPELRQRGGIQHRRDPPAQQRRAHARAAALRLPGGRQQHHQHPAERCKRLVCSTVTSKKTPTEQSLFSMKKHYSYSFLFLWMLSNALWEMYAMTYQINHTGSSCAIGPFITPWLVPHKLIITVLIDKP